jgi:chromosome segregation ATPase
MSERLTAERYNEALTYLMAAVVSIRDAKLSDAWNIVLKDMNADRAEIDALRNQITSQSLRLNETEALNQQLVQRVEQTEKDRDNAEAGEEAMAEKVRSLAPHHTCACSYDRPGDVCAHHSPKLYQAEQHTKAAYIELNATKDEWQKEVTELEQKLQAAEARAVELNHELSKTTEQLNAVTQNFRAAEARAEKWEKRFHAYQEMPANSFTVKLSDAEVRAEQLEWKIAKQSEAVIIANRARQSAEARVESLRLVIETDKRHTQQVEDRLARALSVADRTIGIAAGLLEKSLFRLDPKWDTLRNEIADHVLVCKEALHELERKTPVKPNE